MAKAGTYFVQIMAFAHPPAADVNLKGSPDHVYRLTITNEPYARAVWPPAVQRGMQCRLKPRFGPKDRGVEITADASQFPASEELFHVPTANGEPVLAAIVDPPVITEAEPNNDLANVQRVALPCAVAGGIGTPKDEDRFGFTAKKDESLEFRIRSSALHSPMDAWIRIEADDEKEAGFDPVLNWKAPADGDYVLAEFDIPVTEPRGDRLINKDTRAWLTVVGRAAEEK
jgi:hypothetical protein